jgi:hypothetical protein
MAEQSVNRVATVASGMFISRITSADDSDRQTSYDLNKVTDIEGFVADTWKLVGDFGGVEIRGSILIVSSKVGGTLTVSASNEKYVKEQDALGNKVDTIEVILTTKIFSFYFKIQEYKDLVKNDENFFTNIGRSMSISAGDKVSGDFNPGIDLPPRPRKSTKSLKKFKG